MQSAATVSDAFLSQLGRSCQTDYKLRFWCTMPRRTPLHVKGKCFVELSSKSPLASKVWEAARVAWRLLGLRPAAIAEESELVIYPLCFAHTGKDFVVIMNCLQGREVPPLNHRLIGQVVIYRLGTQSLCSSRRTWALYFFNFSSCSVLYLCLHSVSLPLRATKSSQTQLTCHSSWLLHTYWIFLGIPLKEAPYWGVIKNGSIHKIIEVYQSVMINYKCVIICFWPSVNTTKDF